MGQTVSSDESRAIHLTNSIYVEVDRKRGDVQARCQSEPQPTQDDLLNQYNQADTDAYDHFDTTSRTVAGKPADKVANLVAVATTALTNITAALNDLSDIQRSLDTVTAENDNVSNAIP